MNQKRHTLSKQSIIKWKELCKTSLVLDFVHFQVCNFCRRPLQEKLTQLVHMKTRSVATNVKTEARTT
jgi:hypothetical protein